MDFYKAQYICKLRTANHKFPIKTGRWQNVNKQDRMCPYCLNVSGDEFHYLFVCGKFSELREKYLPQYFKIYPSYDKLYGMLKLCNTKLLWKVAIFLSKIFKEFL